MDTSEQAIQVRDKESKRRFRTVEEKRRIVEQTLEAGASVARVARAHGDNANQVFSWRQFQQGRLERGTSGTLGLLPVRVVEAAPREAARSRSAQTHRTPSGMIHIEFPKGQLRIAGRVDI